MFVFINISSNISSPETVSLYNIDDMYIDGMLLTLTQIILDFVTLLIPAIHCPIEHFMCMRIMDFLTEGLQGFSMYSHIEQGYYHFQLSL